MSVLYSFKGHFEIEGNYLCFMAGPTPSTKGSKESRVNIFRLEIEDPDFRNLLYTYYEGLLERMMRSEREKYYDQGFKDGRAKKKRITEFGDGLSETEIFEWSR